MGNTMTTFDTFAQRLKGWWILMLFGIIAIIAGVAAILSPFSTQVIFIVLMAVSLLIAGIVQLIHTIRSLRSTWTIILGIFGTVLYLAAGFFLLAYPVKGMLLSMIILGIIFTLQRIIQLGIGIDEHDHRGWGWLVTGGIISFILGVLILASLPSV